MKKLKLRFRLRFPINIQISIFLVLVAFIPVAAMMMLKTYESQMLTMMENSNVQQARIVAASLALNPDKPKELLINMKGKFDSRIRILSRDGELLADSSTLEKDSTEDTPQQ